MERLLLSRDIMMIRAWDLVYVSANDIQWKKYFVANDIYKIFQ